MSRKVKRSILALVLLGCVAAGIVVLIGWPRTAITRENAAKIREGMTLAEVEAILGGPARDEASGPLGMDAPELEPGRSRVVLVAWAWLRSTEGDGRSWGSDEVLLRVRFDEQERVTHSEFVPVRRVRERPLDMIRRWFGR